MPLQSKLKSLTVFYCLLLPALSHAAPVNWQAPVGVSTGPGNSSDVSVNGARHHAVNGGSSDVTVNGVLFDAMPGTSGASGFWASGSSGDSAYYQLLNTVNYGLSVSDGAASNGGSSNTITLGDGSKLGGLALNDGQLYEVQIWFVDERSSTDGRVTTFGDNEASPSTVDLNDQYVLGTFTASGSTQTLTALANSFGQVHLF